MILLSTIPVTQSQLRLISLWIHFPIAISQDKDKHLVFVLSAQARLRDRIILKVKLLCLISYSIFLLYNGLWNLQSPRLQTDEKALAALFSFCTPAAVMAVTTSVYQYPADFVILLNMILIYERKVLNSRRKDYDKILRSGKFLKFALRFFGLYGSLAVQIFVVVLVLVKADMPPFIGSVIPRGKKIVSHISKLDLFAALMFTVLAFRTEIYACEGQYSTELNIVRLVASLIESWQYSVLPHVSIMLTANIFITSVFCLLISLQWTLR